MCVSVCITSVGASVHGESAKRTKHPTKLAVCRVLGVPLCVSLYALYQWEHQCMERVLRG